jgi:hypothetical protein
MAWYEYPYNFSNGTEVDGIGSLLKYVNVISDFNLAPAFLILIFLVSFTVGLVANAKAGLMVGGFVASIFSIYFWMLGMVSPFFVILFITLLIIGIITVFLDKYPVA